jgi:hypothetical protein
MIYVFVVLIIQHANLMPYYTVISGLSVSTKSHKRYDFREKLLNVKYVFLICL